MAEFFNLLFNPISNGIMTVLTGFTLLYWLFTLIAGDGFDLDTSGEIAEFDTEISSEGDLNEPSLLSKIFDFINVGKVPIMVVITLFKFLSWILTIVTSLAIDMSAWGIKSIVILLPIFLVVYFSMHWITKPLVKIYKNLGYHGEEEIDFMGRVGVLRSTIQDEKVGMMQLTINQDVINLNVVSKDGIKIDYGTQVEIIDESLDKKLYYITKTITIDNFN